jgi:signal transduction histidine kinase
MPATIEDLKKVIALSDLPEEHLQWLLDHSEYFEYSDGELLMKHGEPADYMWISIEGKVNFYMNVNGRQVYYFTFENNNTTGGIGGLLPYSRMKTSPGWAYAGGKLRGLRLHKDHFHDLEQLNPDFIQRLIGYMTERARAFATTQLQHEKVNALGNLAAGIAHELNNPAAAINRISNELAKRLDRNYLLTEKLLEKNISSLHIQFIRKMVEKKGSKPAEKLSTMQRMEREDELIDWLDKNGITDRETAETLSEYGFTTEELQSILDDAGTEGFQAVLPWLENLIISQRIAKDLDDASCRISNLVGAIKSHVHMDRTQELQPTDIHKDIDNTLTLLGFKLRDKSIDVQKEFCSDMTTVPAYVGELNQVWTNIIDNAIYAMPKNGQLKIKTACNPKDITVSVIDNGGGIPKDIMTRIFDPFFTTKKVGDGSGIGLDIVNRIVKRHNGEIKVNSEPGRTEFKICIPREQTGGSMTPAIGTNK